MASWRCSATAQAMDSPSKVEVPRPISSSTTRLRSVAWWRMAAVSAISTMKVDWAGAGSSGAPPRVKEGSPRADRAPPGGEEAPRLRQEDGERHLAKQGALARHVGAG